MGNTDVLSRPYILGSDNQLATITVGSSVPFITDSVTDSVGAVHNTIDYQDVGIILNVIPHINPDGVVILDINPQVSALTGQTVPLTDKINAVVISKRSATTRIIVRDGQTVIIGGMMQDQKTETVSKVPLIGSIPLIGRFFQRNLTEKTKTELLFFITPIVANKADELESISEHEKSSIKLTPKAIDPGAFGEYMKGMQPPAAPPSED